MSTPEKYFINQLQSHRCQLPPSDDFEYIKRVKKLRNYFLISERSLECYLKTKSIAAIYYEKRRQIRTTQAPIIHPYSEFHRDWQYWMFFVFLLTASVMPFSSAFHGSFYAKYLIFKKKSFDSFYSILYVVFLIQLLIFLNIIFSFLSGYVNSSTGELVIQLPRIARHYIFTYFFIDLAAFVPIDFLVVTIVGKETFIYFSHLTSFFLSLIPLISLFRVYTLYLYFCNFFRRFSFSQTICNMMATTFLSFLLLHWASCASVLVPHLIWGEELFVCKQSPCNTSWLIMFNLLDKPIPHQYAAALYRSLSSWIGIEFKNVKLINMEDRVVTLVVGIVGKVYWLILMVFFLEMVSTFRFGKMRYVEMMDQVQQFMEQKKFPPKLKEKIQKYYLYVFQKEYIAEKRILKLMSDNLQQEVILKIHQRLIEKIHLFSGLSQSVIFDIVSRLKTEIYLKDDIIFHKGSIADCIYFISFGTVAVYSSKGIEIGHLEDGEYFGELSFIFECRRQSTIVALEPTELYSMKQKDFIEVIVPQTHLYSKIEKTAIERYNKVFDEEYFENQEKFFKTNLIKDYAEYEEDDEDYDEVDLDEDDMSY